MAIVYPLSLPANRKLAQINFRARHNVGVTTSEYDYMEQVQDFLGQRWEADITLPLMERAEAEEWNAFLVSLKGRLGTFLLGDPLGETPRGIATGTPLVKGASQTGETLITDGWTINQTGILLVGDYIQLGSGSSARLHKVLENANSDGLGDATLTIWPALRSSPLDNDPITVQNTVGLFRLAINVTMWQERKLIYSTTTIPCVEVI